MKKIAILILSILVAGLFVACNQDVTVDAQTYANMEVGTFVLNGQNYATLQAAVDAIGSKAAGDNVIRLTKNASGPGAKIANKDVTIDFQGYTYSFTNVNGLQGQDVTDKDFGLSITTGSDVVLKGLQKIDLNDKTTTDLTMVYVEGATTSLTIEDAPKMEVANSQYVFWAANGATLTIGSTNVSDEASITGKVAATGGASEDSKPTVTVQGATSITGALEASKANIAIEGNSKIKASVTASDYTTIVVTSKDNIITTLDKTGDSRVVISEDITVQEVAEGSDKEIETVGDATVLDDQGEESTDVDPVEKQYIASIGTRLYEKLAEAITSAESGETILLLSDYDMETNEPGYGWSTNYNNVNTSLRDNCIDFINNDVTFDLNNHKITNLFNNTFRIQADNITIRNGELRVGSLYLYMYSGGTWSSIPEGEGRICSYILYADEGTNLVIDELTTYGGINIASGGLATINNLSFSGTKFYAVCSQRESTVVLNDGTYDKVTGDTTSYLFWIETGSGMIINNGTFLSRDGSINNFASGASPVIYGGEFNFDPSAYVAEGYEAVKDGDYWIVKEAEPVAVNINTGTEYFSLQKAFDEAGDGHTIKILKDIDYGTASYTAANAPVKITKSLNLNGNGHTIKAVSEADSASRFVYITNLYNTSDTPTSDTADSTHITVNISNLTLDFDGLNGYAICYEGNVSGTVENCTIKHPSNGICVKGSHDGDYNYIRADKTFLNVKDCTVTSLNKRTEAIYNAPLDVELGATMTVEGGSYSGDFSATTMSSGGTIILKSGNLANAINVNNNSGYTTEYIWIPGDGYVANSAAQSTVRIEGGNYTNFSGTTVGATGATLSITGGTFDHDPSAYVAEGYEAVPLSSGLYVVREIPEEVSVYSATVNVTTSLLHAVTMLNEMGCPDDLEVTLLEDIDLQGIVWTPAGTTEYPFSGVFDGGGNTISNLSIEATGIGAILNGQGLFGTTEGASISNLHLNNVDISSDFSDKGGVGALVGYALNGIELTNITVDEDSSLHGKYAGGLIGYTNVTKNGSELRDSQFLVSNCKSEATITGTRVGGFVGRMDGSDNTVYAVSNGFAIFTDCSFAGNSTATAGTSDDYAGGFVGQKTNGNPNQIVCSFVNCSVNDAVIEGLRTGDFFGYSNSSYAVWNCKVNNNSIVEPDDFAAYLRGYIFSINGNLYAISVNGEKQSSNIPEFNPQNTTQLQVDDDWYSTIAALDKDKWYFVSNAYSDAIGNIIFVADPNTIFKGSHPDGDNLEDGTKFQRRTHVAGYKYSEPRGYIYLFDMWRIVDESVAPEGTGLGQWQDVGLNGEDGFVIGEGFYFADPTSYLAPSCSVSQSGNIWIVTSGQ